MEWVVRDILLCVANKLRIIDCQNVLYTYLLLWIKNTL